MNLQKMEYFSNYSQKSAANNRAKRTVVLANLLQSAILLKYRQGSISGTRSAALQGMLRCIRETGRAEIKPCRMRIIAGVNTGTATGTGTGTGEMRVQKLSEQRYTKPSALFMVLFATIRSNSATGIGVREGKCPGDGIRCGCSLFSGKE